MKKLMIALAIVAIASVAQADILATWSFAGSNSTDWYAAAPVAASSLGANVDSGSLTFGAGFTATTAANSLRGNGTTWGGTSRTIDLADTSYVQLSLAAASGYTLTVMDITCAMSGSPTGQNGQDRWAANSNGGAYSFVTSQASYGTNGSKPYDVTDTTGSTVGLRYFASPTSGTGTWGFYSASGISVNGTTAPVPEPATMGLLGLGALAMVLRRKMSK